MKTKILKLASLAALLTCLVACSVGKRAASVQLETNSYLHFVSDTPKINSHVWTIVVDKGPKTPIKIDKDTGRFSDDTKYQIPTGTHSVKVYKNNQLYLTKKIFVGNRETKKIKL